MCGSVQDASLLESEYSKVSDQLDDKYNETKTVKDRADRLRDRAAKMFQSTEEKIQKLNGMYESRAV